VPAQEPAGTVAAPRPEFLDLTHLDARGRIVGLALDGEWLDVRHDLRLFRPDWEGMVTLTAGTETTLSVGDAATAGSGLIEPAPGQRCRYFQRVETAPRAARVTLTVVAESGLDIEGVFLWLQLPLADFAGGSAVLLNGSALPAVVALPGGESAEDHAVGGDNAQAVTLLSATRRLSLTLGFDRPAYVQIQDGRHGGGDHLGLLITLRPGRMAAGEVASLGVAMAVQGEADRRPITIEVDAGRSLGRFEGIGGNYCFGIESAHTRYTLDNLRVGWARTQMSLAEWEPANDNDDASRADLGFLASHDGDGTGLRREFELLGELSRRGIPVCISVWGLPEWMYEESGAPAWQNGRRLAEGMREEAAEAVVSYLHYARQKYGAEPRLFSFNEPDYGVRVRLTAEVHRDLIAALGRRLAEAGLRTKMLLGDVTNPWGKLAYVQPAADSEGARRHVGALAFHSWGGAPAAEYAAWRGLADRLGVPLLVTEVGVDSEAWRDGSFTSWPYALREMWMYQELLRHAAPAALLQWELTSDYSLLDGDAGASSGLIPGRRFWLLKHLADLTPPGADCVETTTGPGRVIASAFLRRDGDAAPALALHIANPGAGRRAVVSGIPAGIVEVTPFVTNPESAFARRGTIPVAEGRVEIELPAQSLTTLTSSPP